MEKSSTAPMAISPGVNEDTLVQSHFDRSYKILQQIINAEKDLSSRIYIKPLLDRKITYSIAE